MTAKPPKKTTPPARRPTSAKAKPTAALRTESLLAHELLVGMPEGVWAAGTDLGLIYCNPSIEKVYGLQPGTLVQQPQLWRDMIHKDDRDYVKGRLFAALSMGSNIFEYRVVRPGGEERIVETYAWRMHDSERVTTRLAGRSRDITDVRAQAHAVIAREESARRSLDDVPLMVAYLDTRRRELTLINIPLNRWLGPYAPLHNIAELTAILPNPVLVVLAKHRQMAQNGIASSVELPLEELISGVAKPYHIRFTPRFNDSGQVIGVFMTAAEIVSPTAIKLAASA